MTSARWQRALFCFRSGDSVGIALTDLRRGDDLGDGLRAAGFVPRGGLVARAPLLPGEIVSLDGSVLGTATQMIVGGARLDEANLRWDTPVPEGGGASRRLDLDDRAAGATTFQGIVRPGGAIGTRNYVGVLTTVNCAATVARMVADHFGAAEMAAYPNVDGVVAHTHKSGCVGGGHDTAFACLRRSIAGFARHPNFAAILLLGLGCEDNQLRDLLSAHGLEEDGRLRAVVIQEAGGTRASVRQAVDCVGDMLTAADTVERRPVPAGQVRLGLAFAEPDSLDALAANLALGAAAEQAIRAGGAVIASNLPRIRRAAHFLRDLPPGSPHRRRLEEFFARSDDLLAREAERSETLAPTSPQEDGSLGPLDDSVRASAGLPRGAIEAVCDFAEPAPASGLVLMNSPVHRAVAMTGQVACGANVICAAGAVAAELGCRPVPVLNLAASAAAFAQMQEDFDLGCGGIVEGEASTVAVGALIFDRILRIASGEKTAIERSGLAEGLFAPWHMGATL